MFKSTTANTETVGSSAEVELGSSPSWREYESTFSRLLHDENLNRNQASQGADDIVRSASAVDLSYGKVNGDSAYVENGHQYGAQAGYKTGLFSQDDTSVPPHGRSNSGSALNNGVFSQSTFGLPSDLTGAGSDMGSSDVVSAFSSFGLGTDVPLRPSTAPLPPHGSRSESFVGNATRFSNMSGTGVQSSGMYGGDSSGMDKQNPQAAALLQLQLQQLQQLQQFQSVAPVGMPGMAPFDVSGAGLAGMGMGMPTPDMSQLLASNFNGGGMGNHGGGMGIHGGGYGANGQPQTMAEVYQAAYAAAFYAQQQQLQSLMRMQQVPGLLHPNALNPQQHQQYGGLDGGMNGMGGDGGYGSRMNGRDDRSRVGRTMGRNRSNDRGDRGGGIGGSQSLSGSVARSDSPPSEAEIAEMDSRFGSVENCVGQISVLARDQHGCRFLQRKFDEEGSAAVDLCYTEIIAEAVELMMDPFGNYLVQKLIECCSEEQRSGVLRAVSVVKDDNPDGLPELVTIALNTHGTRAVQKLIEMLNSPEEILLATNALRPGVVTLIKDLNGNHVIQRCLQRLTSEDNHFIYDAAKVNCVEIATHRHGCCVLQRCIDHAVDEQCRPLVHEIASQALVLSQDPFGNYVVQYILDLGLSWANAEVMTQLIGNYAELSMQKFSSNVVEKCLKLPDASLEKNRNIVVREIMQSPLLDRLLMDPYGNYVVQSTLTVTKGVLHTELVERIRPHLPLIKNSPFGKRILRLLLENKK
jgi:hypothetical protein